VRTSCSADRAGCWRDSAPEPAEVAKPERSVVCCASVDGVEARGDLDAGILERIRMLVRTK